ncbi:hypothetical protein SAMN04487948_1336 [Halogranum amylolyticum]|uniref:Uncharacterized protein n=1 Tax=Halogranum amylolyticum TaxID=660520 RepID=A0A1H8WKZ6_9EURY|nr:hypothetical protein SAMN04487948_1336 [Halogranum amylolyticum]
MQVANYYGPEDLRGETVDEQALIEIYSHSHERIYSNRSK